MQEWDNWNDKNKNENFEKDMNNEGELEYVYWIGGNPQAEYSGDRFFIEEKWG